MAFKRYKTESAYETAGLPESESRIALIDETERIAVDHVNTETTEPVPGDILFIKPVTENGQTVNKKVWLKGGDSIRKSLIPNDWTLVGYAFKRVGRKVKVLNKTDTTAKYADVVQFTLTGLTLDGEEHSASIGLILTGGMAAGYGANTTIPFTYQATDLATACQQLNTAIEAAKTNIGFTNTVWSYMINDNNEKAESVAEATKLMVQIDAWSDYQQYNKANSGCTLTYVTWGNMPVSDAAYFKADGSYTQTRGVINVAGAVSYWTTNGRTPTSNEPIHKSGNDNPVTKAAFDESEYCAALREEYGDYTSYIREFFKILYPQKRGVFSKLPTADVLTTAYGNLTAPTKAGSTKYKFPALRHGASVGYDCDGLRVGDWWLSDIRDGIEYMKDDMYAIIRKSQAKMGTTQLAQSAYRWFAQRYGVFNAWYFSGTSRMLNGYYVVNAYHVQAVTLVDID